MYSVAYVGGTCYTHSLIAFLVVKPFKSKVSRATTRLDLERPPLLFKFGPNQRHESARADLNKKGLKISGILF